MDIDNILDEVTNTYGSSSVEVAERKQRAKAQLEQLLVETCNRVIGEDTEIDSPTFRARNQLRAEQRKTLEMLTNLYFT